MRKLREAQEREAQRLKAEEEQIFGEGGEVLDIEPVSFPPTGTTAVAVPGAPPAPVAVAAATAEPMEVDAAPPAAKPKMKLSFKFGAKK